MKKLQILIIGYGKLAKAVQRLVSQNPSIYKSLILSKKTTPLQLDQVDCILDVSCSGVIEGHLAQIVESATPLVIGTTGQCQNELESIRLASKKIPLMLCENFSQGIYLLRQALNTLKKDAFDMRIDEVHHKDKKDAPSGTAKLLQRTLAQACPIHSKRQDDEIGYHSVKINLENEQLQFSHQALSRDLFAKGALKACAFIVQQNPGLYSHYLQS